ncbi:metallophosphoesterase [Flavobacterium crassostreae]|uniref:Phosphoesterase n=1 Tax=Flavobacterium crassostreae TaxID=1763534 RepID=A0A1B9E4Q2_9FLAO|nr:metallophosphoesterase [Flavobacterium crassostreae]OCB76907.1 phosphoesterase [Flavobacterium crassostreae]
MGFRVVVLSVFLLFVEWYAFQALRTVVKGRGVLTAYQIGSALALLFLIYSFTQFDRSVGQTKQTMQTMALLLLIYVPKMILTLVLFGEDLFRIASGALHYFSDTKEPVAFLASRRKFVSRIGLGLAAIPFGSLLYGITIGKYNYKVIKQQIFFPDLPDAFDGFKITQISDVHSGSFDNPDKINYAIDLINAQDTDVVLFTGDIVNTHAEEMDPWIDAFNRIKKPAYGKFAVLGNHDYGEYVTWPTEQDKQANFDKIKSLYQQIDFTLLLNEHTYIQKGKDRLAIIGVENWGHNFKKAGDINKASQNLTPEDFKIVMSHDPSHWDYELKMHPKNFQLTLSGHTHGMQFGIEIPGYFKWSLAQYVYAQWAGLYENLGRYVYVNRGFGFHAYPGRVGIMPEITVLELKKGPKVV